MRTVNVGGFRVQHSAIIFDKLYYFCMDVNNVYFMVKVNEDGSLDVL